MRSSGGEGRGSIPKPGVERRVAPRRLRLQAGGMLIPGKHLYIVRPADEKLWKWLKQGEYCNNSL